MQDQKVLLYKIRDFGEKINATVEYIRENIRPLLKLVLLIIAPIGLLFGILYSSMISSFLQMSSGGSSLSQVERMNMVGSLGTNYLLLILMSMLTAAFLTSAIYMYMQMNEKQEVRPTVLEVYNKILPKIPKLVALLILITIVSCIGMFFLILPGIYLMVTLSLAIPIFLFEEAGVRESFRKSFKLVKGKWWSTFGLLFITGLIASVVSYIFAVPFYAVMIGGVSSTVENGNNDPEAIFAVFSSWYSAAAVAFMMIGSYLTYLIPLIALSFQYFNLSERVDGKGIRDQIQGFETVA